MILAAGRGTRLVPLTDVTPKPLIEVGGRTLLEWVARRLVDAGADRLIVNVHEHAERIASHLDALDLGVELVISREVERPLETGGGVLHAARLFRRGDAFLLHNADIITEIDLGSLLASQRRSGALATLAVHERETSRFLLFDDDGLLGREDASRGSVERVRETRGEVRRLAFAGIHVVDPRFLDLVEERGAFSIMDPYLRLSAAGERVLPVDVTGKLWLEIGTPARLEAARRAMGSA
ncbi:MAG TPA: sugar phosphate nucleotidyltransferase [Gemmatimonadota bacterium]|nr:sugar phosphate nucleotidyltransferase [Gemmatimonadota bacterium]